MKAVALIPTYQPSERLLTTIDALAAEGFAPVVVNDGSGAGHTPVLALASRRATVIGYEANRGKGHALKVGMGYIAGHYPPETIVVTVDDDGQHAARDAARCAREAAAHPGTLVLGSRDIAAPGVPARSRVGNVLTRGLYRLTSGVAVADTQTGLRAFACAMVGQLVGVAGERYEYEMNVLLAAPREGIAIREVPVATIYRDGNAASRFRAVRDSARVWGSLLAFCASSLASFCADCLLFALLVGWLGAAGANVAARLGSASLNFALNRSVVFRARGGLAPQALRYAAVAAALLAASTLALTLLVGVVGIGALAAKVAVEMGLFLLSWALQSRLVFRAEPRRRPGLAAAAA